MQCREQSCVGREMNSMIKYVLFLSYIYESNRWICLKCMPVLVQSGKLPEAQIHIQTMALPQKENDRLHNLLHLSFSIGHDYKQTCMLKTSFQLSLALTARQFVHFTAFYGCVCFTFQLYIFGRLSWFAWAVGQRQSSSVPCSA